MLVGPRTGASRRKPWPIARARNRIALGGGMMLLLVLGWLLVVLRASDDDAVFIQGIQ